MSRRLLPLIIIAIGIGGYLLLTLSRPAPDPVSAQERSWLVEVVIVQPGRHVPELALYGELMAPEQVQVTAPVAGRIDARPVREGQRVAEGDLLLAMDKADIEPLLASADADVLDLEAQVAAEAVRFANDKKALNGENAILENARRQSERTGSLVSRNLSSQEALDTASDTLARARLTVTVRERAIAEHPSRLKSLKARLARAEAAQASARTDAERARVVAPFDGVITGVEVASGDQVSQNAPLLRIYPDQGLELRAKVPDRYRAELIRALDSGASLKAVSEDGNHRFTLVRFAGTSDPTGVEAILTLTGRAGGLRPGGLLPVSLQRPVAEESVAVPYSALYGSDSVYLMNAENRMQRVHVRRLGEVAGSEGERQVLIASPELQAGQQLITTHLPNAMSGLKVQVADAAAGAIE